MIAQRRVILATAGAPDPMFKRAASPSPPRAIAHIRPLMVRLIAEIQDRLAGGSKPPQSPSSDRGAVTGAERRRSPDRR